MVRHLEGHKPVEDLRWRTCCIRGGARAQLVSSSVIPAACPKVAGRRAAPPSRNALSAVFLREDEGSHATSSGPNQDDERERADRELMQHEVS